MSSGTRSYFSGKVSTITVSCLEIIPLIFPALKKGQRVRITGNGNSMLPFIHNNDVVELEMIRTLPVKGDIVLVQCSEKKYIIHRIAKIKKEKVFLRGDAQLVCEGPFTFENILGKVTKSFHNGQIRTHHQGMWHFAGLIWIHTYKIVRFTKFVIWFPRKCASKIFRLIMGTNFRAYLEKENKKK